MEESSKVRKSRCYDVLKVLRRNAEAGTVRPVLAVALADAAGIRGSHENRRRRVRELIEDLHASGERICAASGVPEKRGYWIARNDEEWSTYQAARKSHAKFEFAVVRQMHSAANDRSVGQGRLFENSETQKAESRNARTAWAGV